MRGGYRRLKYEITGNIATGLRIAIDDEPNVPLGEGWAVEASFGKLKGELLRTPVYQFIIDSLGIIEVHTADTFQTLPKHFVALTVGKRFVRESWSPHPDATHECRNCGTMFDVLVPADKALLYAVDWSKMHRKLGAGLYHSVSGTLPGSTPCGPVHPLPAPVVALTVVAVPTMDALLKSQV